MKPEQELSLPQSVTGPSELLRLIGLSVLQDYISEFKFKSVVAQDLIDFFLRCFPELQDAAVAQREGEVESLQVVLTTNNDPV